MKVQRTYVWVVWWIIYDLEPYLIKYFHSVDCSMRTGTIMQHNIIWQMSSACHAASHSIVHCLPPHPYHENDKHWYCESQNGVSISLPSWLRIEHLSDMRRWVLPFLLWLVVVGHVSSSIPTRLKTGVTFLMITDQKVVTDVQTVIRTLLRKFSWNHPAQTLRA
jgi:hypothetical protein